MKKQIISFELDEELSKEKQDEIFKILEESEAKNIEIKFEEEEEAY